MKRWQPVENTKSNAQSGILFIHSGALGDVICALNAIECLIDHTKFDFCCQEHIIPFLSTVPGINNVINIHHPHITSMFLAENCDKVNNWLCTYQIIVLFSFSKDWEFSLKKCHPNIIRVPPRPPVDDVIHTSQFIYNTLQQTDVISGNYKEIQDFVLQKQNNSYRICQWKTVIIHPGSGSSFKNWPLERFMSLGQQLCQFGYSVKWLIGPAETSLVTLLLQNSVANNDIIHTNELQIVMHCLNQSSYFAGNDSGISHLAAYMGIDTTVIFGPSDFRRWQPMGPNVKTIPDNHLICSPCFEKGSRECSHKKCLHDISVTQVMHKIIRKL